MGRLLEDLFGELLSSSYGIVQKLPPCSMLSCIFLIYWENAELRRGSWQRKKVGQQEKKALLTTTRTILVLLTSQKLGQAKAMDCCVCLHWPLPQMKCQVTWLAMQGARSLFCGDFSHRDNFSCQVTDKVGVKCVQQTLKAIFAQMSSSVIGKKREPSTTLHSASGRAEEGMAGSVHPFST